MSLFWIQFLTGLPCFVAGYWLCAFVESRKTGYTRPFWFLR